MCFAPEADLAAGLVVGAVGVDTLRHARRRQDLGLASLPALFAAHQVSEAFVWWGLDDQVAWSTARVALWLYMLFAYVVLPVLVPMAVLAAEPGTRRGGPLPWFATVGLALAATYLAAMVRGPVGVEIEGRHLVYHTSASNGGLLAGIYAVVVCGALLASSHRAIVAFGVVNAIAVAVLTWVASTALTSLWCLWAAVTSVAISAHVRRAALLPDRASTGPDRPGVLSRLRIQL